MVNELVQEDSKVATTHIFDPRIRRQIENSKQYYANTGPIKSDQPELIMQRLNSNMVRIGEHFLRIPVETSYDPENLRIMSFESNCPKKKKAEFFNDPSLQ